MVFKKILVAIDRSPQAQVVLEQALELAQKEESTLMVFHCVSWELVAQAQPFIGTLVDVDMSGTFQRLQRERVQKNIEQARDWLATCCQQATSKDIPTEFDCKTGDPNLKICELAKAWGADLIVVGRRGHKGLSEMLLGSVSNYVVHNAPCSVLVVQGVIAQRVDTPAEATPVKMNV
jgi:nucleotide-binding universal stress UspA family protein